MDTALADRMVSLVGKNLGYRIRWIQICTSALTLTSCGGGGGGSNCLISLAFVSKMVGSGRESTF